MELANSLSLNLKETVLFAILKITFESIFDFFLFFECVIKYMYFLFLEIIKLLFWEIDYSQKCNIPMDELVFGRSSQCVGNGAR